MPGRSVPFLAKGYGAWAEEGILAYEPKARSQLRDSAGLSPVFPRLLPALPAGIPLPGY